MLFIRANTMKKERMVYIILQALRYWECQVVQHQADFQSTSHAL